MKNISPVLPVAQRGEAILKLIAVPVVESEFSSEWLSTLSQVLQATMQERNGVGIAAPQVYISKRIIIVASRPNPRYLDAPEMEAICMVNPEIIEQSISSELGEEGCLSVPDERGQVARASEITVQYFSIHGEKTVQTFRGFPARIVQHEIDHLNGILFVERLS